MANFKEEYLDRYGYSKNNYFEDEDDERDYNGTVTKTLYDYLQDEENKNQMYETIKEIVDFMNFEKIHRVMKFLDWKWAVLPTTNEYNYNRVPTAEDLKRQLIDMLLRMFEEGYNRHKSEGASSTGGFSVSYRIYEPEDDEPDDFKHCVSVSAAFNLEDYNSMM